LLSSATTTASGFTVLIAALLPDLRTFGVITALTIAFAFVASVFVLPSLLALWAELPGVTPETAEGVEAADSPTPTDVAETTPIDPVESSEIVGRGSTRQSPSGAETVPTDVESDGCLAIRSLSERYVPPGHTTTARISVRGDAGRVYLREHPPGTPEAVIEVSPDPVEAVFHEGTLYVLWDLENGSDDPTVAYSVTAPSISTGEKAVTFHGTVAADGTDRTVAGHTSLTVHPDPFQRALERGAVTDVDVRTAAARIDGPDRSATEFDRLCRVWLRESRDDSEPLESD
jgi:hypothetical protein